MSTSTARQRAMAVFLEAAGWRGYIPRMLAGDASFRRYYRLSDGRRRVLLMDAPPPQEDVGAYLTVARILRDYGFSAPEIYAEDREHGFLLIEDFGDSTYTSLLARGADETALYALAIDTLVALHRVAEAERLLQLPPYNEERFLAEAGLLAEWYLPSVLGAELSVAARADYAGHWREVLHEAELGAATLVLRDYHVDNLMLLPGREAIRRCGLLDFQDAVRGPASYDLVSLLEDARRDVSPTLRDAMTERYLTQFPDLDRRRFRRSAAILAAQRNCKIIGIFTRLWRRDGKPQYLAHIPRVWRLLEADLREPALRPVTDWLDHHLPAVARRVPALRSAP